MTKNKAHRTKAKIARDREAHHLSKLCNEHGYAFADTLPASERSTITMTRKTDANGRRDKVKMSSAVVVRLMAPWDSALGKLIAKEREAERVKAAKQTKKKPNHG